MSMTLEKSLLLIASEVSTERLVQCIGVASKNHKLGKRDTW